MRFMRHKILPFFECSRICASFGVLGVFLFCSAAYVPVSYAQEDALPSVEGEASSDAAADVPAGGEAFDFDDSGLELEKSSEELENDFRKEAFDKALEKMMPLAPEEIRTLLEHFDRTVESSNLPVHPYPRPESVVKNISLDPGSEPTVIRLAFGYVTTLSILDGTGRPWPIEDISWVGDFDVMEDTTKEFTHLLRISPESKFAHGNLSMRVVGLDAPIIFTFETGRDMVHYRFDAVLPGNGPQATTPLIDTGVTLASGDPDMSVALSGVVPKDAEVLEVSGVDGRTTAYVYNGLTYVRTPLNLLSPAWDGSVTSADGTKVYSLEETPVILLSDKGRMVRAYLSKREEVIDE